jgi:DNA polymerase elongation subunit (family B)
MSKELTKKGLDKFLGEKKGYSKFGSKALMDIMIEKGYSLTKLTQEEVKESLRLASAGYIPGAKKAKKPLKLLTYDIETSLVEARLWGSGKQYVGHNSITTETQIITVAWKWIGEDNVHTLKWDMKKKTDKKLITKFLEEYNKADMVIGFNNNSFDNKIVNARAMKYNLEVDTTIKSFDIMRQMKSKFRLPSYSMAYIAKYLGLQGKLNYSGGIQMWNDIGFGTKKIAKAAMKIMIAYNVQDVALTEEIYFRLRKYLGNVIHTGVLTGQPKATCPNCGSDKIKLYKTHATPAGAIQRVMICKKDGVKFKMSNSEYLKTL